MKTKNKTNHKINFLLILVGILILIEIGGVFAAGLTTLDSNSPDLKGRIEPGGHLDYVGDKLVKADFTFINDDAINLNGYKYKLKKGTHVKLDNKEITINVKGGSFSYYPVGDDKKEQSFSDIKSGGEFKFDEKGEIVSAKFSVDKETPLKLKGYKDYTLPKDSEVTIDGKNKKVDIVVPDGTKLDKSPEKEAGAEEGVVFSFKTKSNGALTLSNGDKFSSKDKDGNVLYSKGSGFYFTSQNSEIQKDGKTDFSIYNKDKKEVYLVFDKKDIVTLGDKSSIYIGEEGGKKTMILTSLKESGSAITFSENNRFGIKVTQQNTAAVQPDKGKVFIAQRDAGKVADIKISGGSSVTLDKRTFSAQVNNLYFDPNKQIDSGGSHGSLSVASKIVLVDNDEKNLLGFDVYANDRDQYASVNPNQIKEAGGLSFFNTRGNFYVSSTVAFNQLSYEQQKFYDGTLNPQIKQQISGSIAGKSGKEDIFKFQSIVEGLRKEDEKARQNPILASVRIRSGGGSGTIIGKSAKDGHYYVLSAGHLAGATRPGAKETIQLSDGRKFTATVVGGRGDWGGSGNDYSLMRIDQLVDNLPYIPIASESVILNKNDLALRIGCPGCGPFKQTQTKLGRIGNIIGHGSSEGIRGGESGGGLFSKGRLVGVVSTGGYYTGTNPIRQFARKLGLGDLIQGYILALLDKIKIYNTE